MNNIQNLRTSSRRTTPWTNDSSATPTQVFIDSVVRNLFEERHKAISETAEVELVNAIGPKDCHHCGSSNFMRYGKDRNGIRCYKCKDCGRKFNVLTGTIFQNHKISITEWIDYCLQLFSHMSFNSISKSNRNALTTTRYWLDKIFMVLEGYQDDLVLEGNVYLDETYRKVVKREIQIRPDGKEYRGLSRNQMCIGLACDAKHVLAIYEGLGRPSLEKTQATFLSHIAEGSHLIHDQERSHKVLVEKLKLTSETYNSKDMKKLKDEKDPLNPINWECYLLQHFLDAHSAYSRSMIQGYLDLYAFIRNEGDNSYEKVEKLLMRCFDTRKTMTYRGKYAN